MTRALENQFLIVSKRIGGAESARVFSCHQNVCVFFSGNCELFMLFVDDETQLEIHSHKPNQTNAHTHQHTNHIRFVLVRDRDRWAIDVLGRIIEICEFLCPKYVCVCV